MGTLVLLAAQLSCPPRPAPPVTGVERASQACPDAIERMVDGHFAEAERMLRERSDRDLDFHTDPRSNICLARAHLGTGDQAAALRLVAPLQTSLGVDSEVRAGACVYGAWASATIGDLDGSRRQIDACDRFEPIALEGLLLPSDRLPAALLLLDARAERGAVMAALPVASSLLDSFGQQTEGGRLWAIDRALALAKSASDEELEELVGREDSFLQAVGLYGQLFRAITEDRTDRIPALTPEVQARLADLGAEGGLLEVTQWVSQLDRSRPALLGAVLSLSGPHRRASRAALAGFLLAQEAFQTDVLSHSRFLLADAGESDRSVSEAVAGLDEQGVLAMIGYVDPQLIDSLAREAETRAIPLVLLSSDSDVVRHGEWIFRYFADPEIEARVLARFAAREGLSRIAVALPIPTPAYMQSLVSAFDREAAVHGITVDEPVGYDTDDLQQGAQSAAQTLALREFDGLLIADGPTRANTLAAYLGVQDVWSREPGAPASNSRREVLFLGNSVWHNPEFLASGPDYLAGAVFTSWLPLELERSATRRFVDEFIRVFARRPGIIDAFAHDAVFLLRYLTVDCGLHTRGAVGTALQNVEGLEGATGELRLGPDRSNSAEPWLFQVTSRGFVPR